MKKTLKAIVQFQRKPLEQYDSEQVILKGEICLVDIIATNELRVKIGDGVNKFGRLPYLDNINTIIMRGYYYQDDFFYEEQHYNKMEGAVNKIYIDAISGKAYLFNGTSYFILNDVPQASAVQAGVVKLYPELGNNTDGACDQKIVTEEIGKKFEVTVDANGNLIFTK